MFDVCSSTCSIQHGKTFASDAIKKNPPLAFKDHPQFSILADSLSRKDHHHVILCAEFLATMRNVFLEAFIYYLSHSNIPYSLRDANLVYLSSDILNAYDAEKKSVENDFQMIQDYLNKTDKYLLIALPTFDWLYKPTNSFFRKQFEFFWSHPKCRLVVLTTKDQQYHFVSKDFTWLNLQAPNENDMMAILKQQRTELEAFHHVLIPEELLSFALTLAERYLSTNTVLEKAMLLLDSGAARASAMERIENNTVFKPVLTTAILLNVLSGWIQVPATHLHFNKFNCNEFLQGMHEYIFEQEPALAILSQTLQQSQTYLQKQNGPMASFLFAGPEHSGKKTTALFLTEQLFKQTHALYFVQSSLANHSLVTELKVQRALTSQMLTLKDVIRKMPYAIFFFDEIEKASANLLENLQEILHTGYLYDEAGNQYDFRQSIILFSTTLGSKRLHEIAKTIASDEEEHEVNLMQLVMNELKHETNRSHHQYAPQEIVEEIQAEIQNHLPSAFCGNVQIVPFLPLTSSAVEKVIRLKLKMLGDQLEIDPRYGIELSYAPEVVRYLANLAFSSEQETYRVNIKSALKKIHLCIDQAMMNQTENKNRSNQLFLHLNETGQLLRYDWITMSSAGQHSL